MGSTPQHTKGSVDYRTLDGDFTLHVDYKIDLDSDSEDIAEECARDYYERHDGWEAHWPLTITLLLSAGPVELEVCLDFEPCFGASLLDDTTG